LTQVDVAHKKIEFNGSIGQHHARADEMAIPFGIIIDLDSLKEPYAVLRERDSTHQVRIPVSVKVFIYYKSGRIKAPCFSFIY
jgi:Anticodon binding domain